MDLTRRSFIRWVIAASAASACPSAFAGAGGKDASSPKPAPPDRFSSEDNSVCHRVRDGDSMPMPAPSETHDVVIVGAGPSGLGAADHLQDRDFLLLEKEGHVGGNCYAESWEGCEYSTGAAWASIFSPEVDALFKKWKFDLKPIAGLDAACFDGAWVPSFWNGDADHPSNDLLPYSAEVKKSVKDFCRKTAAIDFEAEKAKLDLLPFTDLLKGHAPILTQYWDGFGLSNWGAPAALTSAYLGVQAAQAWPKVQRYTFEGGLGVGARRMHESLSARAKKRVRLNAPVYSVVREKKRAVVRYMQDGKPVAVAARAVVMAAPKYIAKYLVSDIPLPQAKAMAAIRYAPYLIYNLCFDRVVYNQAYDNWVVGAKNFTDFIPADFVTHGAGGDLSRKQVITVYSPQNESARPELLDEAKVLAKAHAAVGELLELFPSWTEHLREVRIYRRGHPMFMSTPGLYTGLQPEASKDLPPVFFAHSDSGAEVSDLAYAAVNGIAAAKKALAHL